MTQKFVALAVALLVIAGGVYWKYGRAKDGPALKFETTKVEKGRLVAKVTATGTLSALVTVQVGAQVSGRIQQLGADFNSAVKKGQLIARIDPQIYEAAVQQAKANLTQAEGMLAKNKAQSANDHRILERDKALRVQQLVAQQDLDTAQATADADDAAILAAQGQLEQATASLHQAEVNLDYTRIISPIDGVVISRSVDVGQTVASAFQAPTLFTIAEDLKKMQVDTNVAEADVGKLRPGMDASFTVDAYPSLVFKGVVRQIRNAPQTVQNVVTYDAVIDVANPELKLKPGMTANVTFVYAEKDAVVRVAQAALRFRPTPDMLASLGGPGGGHRGGQNGGPARVRPATEPADHRSLWVLRDGKPTPVPVRIGISDGTYTEIAEGDVREGDQAITDVTGGGGGGHGMRGFRL